MAATRIIEEEHGTYFGSPRHPHQGYYAGDFSQRPTARDGFSATCAQDDPEYAPTRGWC
jgi:hypothetical protein